MAQSKFAKDTNAEHYHTKAARLRKEKAKKTQVWSPQRGPQDAFLRSPVDELLYGGAAGGGKSEGLVIMAVALCQQHPGYRAIIFRRTFPEIEKSLVPRVSALLGGIARSRNKGMEWIFPNKSVLYLSHMQREEDKEKHKSSEYDFIGFDELTSFTESQYTYLFSRCRGAQDYPRMVRSATNPTGIGHSWVKQRFVDMPKDQNDKFLNVTPYATVPYEFAYGWQANGQVYTSFSDLPKSYAKGSPVFSEEEYVVYKERKSGLTRAFLPALLWGNAALLKNDPDYVKRLAALDRKQQEALLYGKWSIFEGQFFEEWDNDIHTCDPFSIPSSWQRFVAIDYGYTAPFVALFGAINEDGVLYIYRELYGSKLTTKEQAESILESIQENERIEWFAADPAMWQRQGTAESHSDVYARHNLHLIASSNKRVPGWAIVHEYLHAHKLVFFRNCVNSIRTIPTLMHSKTNPEDLDTHQEDHAADALRYMLLTLRGHRTNVRTEAQTVPDWFKAVKKKQKQKRKNKRLRI
jgi:hypothetical protein